MIDTLLMFSDNQAITATAPSENVIDLGQDREIAFGNPIPLVVLVKQDFNNLTTLKVAVETSDTDNFSSFIELCSSTVSLENLKKGSYIPLCFMPSGNKGYVRLNFTVTGTDPTTGKVTAYLTDCVSQSHHNKN